MDFTEEIAGALHELTHEVSSLRMCLDGKLDNLTQAIRYVSNQRN